MSSPTICLSMIVKNEEKDIKRCLESVIPFIDYWVISDTGSTDKTKKVIQDLMDKHGVPGELHDHEWVDFSTNRNYALELSRPHADYIWFMDADDNFVPNGPDPFSILSDEYEMYHMNYTINDGVFFSRACIMNSKSDFQFNGVLHETLGLKDGSVYPGDKRAALTGSGHIVARASPLKRNKTEKEKYLSDAAILEKDLEENPLNYRSMFYLGQSYQLAENLIQAIDAYYLRAMFPDEGNTDEVFLALYEIAKMKISLKFPEEECIDCCVRAWEFDSSRIEPICLAMQYLYNRGRIGYALALGDMAKQTVSVHPSAPKIDSAIYDYKFPQIYSICLFSSGMKKNAIDSLNKLIEIYKDDPSKATAISVLTQTLDTFNKNISNDE